jgi:hypothetical protein
VSLKNLSAAFFVVVLMVVAAPKTVSAGPIIVFSTSTGYNPSNVGIITLTQVSATQVNVLVDLIDTALPNPQYGFLNTGGPHTPLAFNLSGSDAGVTAQFVQPLQPPGTLFSLDVTGGSATPFGTFGTALVLNAGNGSTNAYFGDLEFVLTRASGLETTDFIANANGWFFGADLTNGNGSAPFGNTGSQAWTGVGINPTCVDGACPSPVPEPASMLLLGTGLLAAARTARRRKTN